MITRRIALLGAAAAALIVATPALAADDLKLRSASNPTRNSLT